MKLSTIEKYTKIFNSAIQAKKPLREYCKENKIPLLHIYYKKNYSIKWEDLELYNGVE